MARRVVIKVGTNVITGEDKLLNQPHMHHLVKQVARLIGDGYEVLVVSSGAIGAGRGVMQLPEKIDQVAQRQILAAVGQVELMKIYSDLFANFELRSAQVLATKSDFRDRQHYLNMKSCLENVLDQGVVPIVNENDVVSVSQLMFTDNDDLAGMVASMMGAEALILLTNVNGLYDKSPIVPDAKLIPEVTKQTDVVNYVTKERSQFGRGGMMTKVGVGRKMAKLGIATYIVNGNTENILIDLLINQQPRGTYFPVEQQVSQVKKWVAYGQGMHKGEVIINQGAVDVLLSPEKVASLLPVGVVKVVGDFQKGDLIKIKDEHGDDIGLGMAQYDADQAREVIGQSGMKPLIHYDYLYLE